MSIHFERESGRYTIGYRGYTANADAAVDTVYAFMSHIQYGKEQGHLANPR